MNKTIERFRCCLYGACLALFAGQPLWADDTEIFVGQSLDGGQANVLFIIDTSGSMGATVEWDPVYDPNVTYDGDCPADRVYFFEDAAEPTSVCKDADFWVHDNVFVCQKGWQALNTSGHYSDRMAQYYAESKIGERTWGAIDKSRENWMVDCQADNGLHGDGSNSVAVYPQNNDWDAYSTEPTGANHHDWNSSSNYLAASGNYMNFQESVGNQTYTRLDVVKIVAKNTISQVSGINVGMMRFDRGAAGGMVTRAMAPISTELGPMTAALENFKYGGGTPLAETLYEAGQYFAGRNVDYGLNSRGNDYVDEPSVNDSRDGNTYISPIATQCQKNFIVLLTDGEPTSDSGANARIAGLPGFTEATNQAACSGNCLDEMAAYLHNHDLRGDLPGQQTVDTYTIGFHTNQELLSQTATRGGGLYYTADSAEELTQAFVEILENIIEQDVSFTAPAVSVNTFNRLTHRDELFFSMFKPMNHPHWEGNIKRYRLDNSGGVKQIFDATNKPAINPNTETFYEDAKSFWTLGDPDGYLTTEGGFRSRLHAERKVLTVTNGASLNVPLNIPANQVHESNSEITAALLGVDAGERLSLIRWARGVNNAGEPTRIMGDSLHSRPVVMSWGGSESNPDLTLFAITNDGYFHAIDPTATAAENMELFAFIPGELLPRLAQLKANVQNKPPKFYGLDGQMTALIINDNGNGQVDAGEKAMVYFGMRRGGRNYYALDVTDRANPRLAFVIRGGYGAFTELGQSWSEMSPARVRINGGVRDVLLFGGGYDPLQDPAGNNVEDTMGRAIFMIDAQTGERLWWAANAVDNEDAALPSYEMTNSIPSDLRIVDMNGDGLHDRIYVGDMTGQMWRFDIDNDAGSVSQLVTGGIIADIGGKSSQTNRRIFYPPSLALVADEYLGSFLAVSFGTGHRANPLGTSGKTVDDRFYMLRDPYVFSPELDKDGDPTYSSVDEGDFYDVSTDLAPSTEQLNGHNGWMIRLDHEEKVLARSLVADGRIFFTTYLPESASNLTCNPQGALGSARAYAVDIATGRPRINEDSLPPSDTPPESLVCGARCVPTRGPIPPEPVLIFTEPDSDPPACPPGEVCADPCDGMADVALVIGTDVQDPNICTGPVRTYWVADGEY